VPGGRIGLSAVRYRCGAMSYRLLCLDAGFTLLTPRRTLADALSGVLAADGHAATEDEMRVAWEEADRWFWDEYHRPDNDTWSDDRRIEAYWRRYHRVMLGRLGMEARREVLDRIRIGVVSDWGSNLRGILAGLGLDRHLDFVLPSGAVGVAKPNPAFYRMALEAVDVAARQALMVGDSYRADVRGAWSAGMDAVWLDRHEGISITPPDEPMPTDVRRIRSLDELPTIVREGGPLPRGERASLDPAPASPA
jgi:FMN phosphatase YigB (HAD superfamily)